MCENQLVSYFSAAYQHSGNSFHLSSVLESLFTKGHVLFCLGLMSYFGGTHHPVGFW